jgi:hypothetical protein
MHTHKINRTFKNGLEINFSHQKKPLEKYTCVLKCEFEEFDISGVKTEKSYLQ